MEVVWVGMLEDNKTEDDIWRCLLVFIMDVYLISSVCSLPRACIYIPSRA